jgi:hypothetical protein
MKKYIILFLLSLALTVSVFAQRKGMGIGYTTALGAKFYPAAFTIKQKIVPNVMLEGLMYFWNGARVTGLVEWHHNIQGLPGLRWYAGPGVHLQFNETSSNYFGIDGVVGLDWKIKNVPINLSLDWQPSFDFTNNNNFKGEFGGLSIRYVL